jgi:hypothetical protein
MPSRQNRTVGVPTAGGFRRPTVVRIHGVKLGKGALPVAGALNPNQGGTALGATPHPGAGGYFRAARRGHALAKLGRAAAGTAGTNPVSVNRGGEAHVFRAPTSVAPSKPAAATIRQITTAAKRVSRGAKQL